MGDQRETRRPGRAARRVLVVAALLFVLLAAAIAGGPHFIQSNPDAVTNAVDRLREIVGPGPVAAIENTYYRAVDVYDRMRYGLTGESTTWALNAPAIATPPIVPTVAPAPVVSTARRIGAAPGASGLVRAPARGAANTRPAARSSSATGTAASVAAATIPAPTAAPAQPASQDAAAASPSAPASGGATFDSPPPVAPILDSPGPAGEGAWQPLPTLGQPAGEPPLLWQTVLRVDPSRPYAAVALVAMDLSRTQLHMVIGTREPASSVPGIRTGMIPADVQASGSLLAAWNGGFKAVHGHYGMMTDGVVWLPAKDGMATAAIDRQGRLTIGAWGRGVKPDQAWLAWRQNNPPLIEDGVVNPDVIKLANTVRWGASLDGAVFIWRSGMGITQDGRWLIYAAGNSLSVQTLTAALQAAGAYNAMQLDVNMSFERFDVFSAAPQTAKVDGKAVTLPITSVKLIREMQGGPAQFLVPYDRDFFYLTTRQ